jgi:hypothetical protein
VWNAFIPHRSTSFAKKQSEAGLKLSQFLGEATNSRNVPGQYRALTDNLTEDTTIASICEAIGQEAEPCLATLLSPKRTWATPIDTLISIESLRGMILKKISNNALVQIFSSYFADYTGPRELPITVDENWTRQSAKLYLLRNVAAKSEVEVQFYHELTRYDLYARDFEQSRILRHWQNQSQEGLLQGIDIRPRVLEIEDDIPGILPVNELYERLRAIFVFAHRVKVPIRIHVHHLESTGFFLETLERLLGNFTKRVPIIFSVDDYFSHDWVMKLKERVGFKFGLEIVPSACELVNRPLCGALLSGLQDLHLHGIPVSISIDRTGIIDESAAWPVAKIQAMAIEARADWDTLPQAVRPTCGNHVIEVIK